MWCDRCGKKIDTSHHGGALISLNDHYCKECAEKLNSKDMRLLRAIARGENIYNYIKNEE